MQQELIVAFATDNGKHLTNEHFGEAKEYLIYNLSKNEAKYVDVVNNIPLKEEMHADPRKANGIAGLLKTHKVNVIVNQAFGANIKRMNKKFVCIISKQNIIDDCIANIQVNIEDIIVAHNKGEERDNLRL